MAQKNAFQRKREESLRKLKRLIIAWKGSAYETKTDIYQHVFLSNFSA